MLHHEAKWSVWFIQPGKPWQNGYIESFPLTLRRDDLDAKLKTGMYRNDTNQVRPYSELGCKAPAEVTIMKAGFLMVSLGYQMGANQVWSKG